MTIPKAIELSKEFLSGKYGEEAIDQLRELIRFHDYHYRVLSTPIIDDSAYDHLFSLLLKRESLCSPIEIPADSPSRLVGLDTIEAFAKATHRVPMLSLQNTYTRFDIESRGERSERVLSKLIENEKIYGYHYLIEPKLDGSSIQIVYSFGKLSHAATRGNGYVGEDITLHAMKISNLPHEVSKWKDIEEVVLRAEVVLPEEAFDRVNAEVLQAGGQIFANARNAASGTLRNLDTTLVYKRGLQCYVFEMLEGLTGFERDSELIEYLIQTGLPVHPRFETVDTIAEVSILCESEETRNYTQFGSVACDGLVIKIDEYHIRQALGSTEHHPKRAIAYKYPAQEVVAHLRDIIRQVGRTGVVTPVAELDPVAVGGVIVQRATLHNSAFIQERRLVPGIEVRIKRSGEVIPYVIGRVIHNDDTNELMYSFPESCPVCSHELLMSDDYKRLICLNIHCPAQQKERLKHYVSRDAANIDGLGGSLVELLYDTGLLSSIESLYQLDTQENTIKALSLEGVGRVKRDKVITSIHDSKYKPFSDILYGLGILGVGKKLAKTLTTYYSLHYTASYTNLYEYLCIQNTQEVLLQLHGIGDELAKNISKRTIRDETKELIDVLEGNAVLTLEKLSGVSQHLSTGGVYSGKTFVITGSFDVGRKIVSDRIESMGGSVTPSLSGSTDFLLVGEKPGSKVEKAKKLGVQIILGDDIDSIFGKKSSEKIVKQSDSFQQQNLFGI